MTMLLKSTKVHRFAQEVADLNIQGATAIGRATLEVIAHLASGISPQRASEWRALSREVELISRVRPAEPLARNLGRWYVSELRRRWRTARRTEWLALCDAVADDIRYQLEAAEKNVSRYGSRLVRQGQVIFTHCHSSLAESILTQARRQGARFSVYHTETRPRYQGRITAEHLMQHGIKATMVTDSAAAWLVSKHSGDDVDVDWVLLGADSVGKDGSAVNKIGSFGIALTAHDSKLPVYVATTLMKMDWANESRIERRAVSEIWAGAPKGVRMVNYAFDCIPQKYITGLITEFGVIKPAAAARLARRNYPWLARGPLVKPLRRP